MGVYTGGDFKMSEFRDLLKGIDNKKLSEAMKKAELLAQNEEIKKAFSGADKNKLKNLFSELDSMNKDDVINKIMSSDNRGIAELLKKIKG